MTAVLFQRKSWMYLWLLDLWKPAMCCCRHHPDTLLWWKLDCYCFYAPNVLLMSIYHSTVLPSAETRNKASSPTLMNIAESISYTVCVCLCMHVCIYRYTCINIPDPIRHVHLINVHQKQQQEKERVVLWSDWLSLLTDWLHSESSNAPV